MNSTIAVFGGRMAPPHLDHIALIHAALSRGETVVVFLGSAGAPRNSENPFTAYERATMIRMTLSDEDAARVVFLPIRDYYDDQIWADVLREGVEAIAREKGVERPEISLIGAVKDKTSYYLNLFPDWKLVTLPVVSSRSSTSIRELIFGGGDYEIGLKIAAPNLHAGVERYLKAWRHDPACQGRIAEHLQVEAYKRKYPNGGLAGDVLLESGSKIALIQRGKESGDDQWAMPGGFVDPGEHFTAAAFRELDEETCVGIPHEILTRHTRQTFFAHHPRRSPRGRIVSMVHHIVLASGSHPKLTPNDGVKDAQWIEKLDFVGMAEVCFEDHYQLVMKALGLTPPRLGHFVLA